MEKRQDKKSSLICFLVAFITVNTVIPPSYAIQLGGTNGMCIAGLILASVYRYQFKKSQQDDKKETSLCSKKIQEEKFIPRYSFSKCAELNKILTTDYWKNFLYLVDDGILSKHGLYGYLDTCINPLILSCGTYVSLIALKQLLIKGEISIKNLVDTFDC